MPCFEISKGAGSKIEGGGFPNTLVIGLEHKGFSKGRSPSPYVHLTGQNCTKGQSPSPIQGCVVGQSPSLSQGFVIGPNPSPSSHSQGFIVGRSPSPSVYMDEVERPIKKTFSPYQRESGLGLSVELEEGFVCPRSFSLRGCGEFVEEDRDIQEDLPTRSFLFSEKGPTMRR